MTFRSVGRRMAAVTLSKRKKDSVMKTPKKHIIGTGNLSWPRMERVSDRYGTVGLTTDAIDYTSTLPTPPDCLRPLNIPSGYGSIVARVLSTSEPVHLGDIARGIAAKQPRVGELIILGTGDVFEDSLDGWMLIGLKPYNKRSSDWLNPLALYMCHNQKVELSFHSEYSHPFRRYCEHDVMFCGMFGLCGECIGDPACTIQNELV